MINTKIKQAHTSSNMFDWRAEGAIYNSVYTESSGWITHYYMYMTPLIAVRGGETYTWRISADTSSSSSRLTDITTVYYDKDLNEIGCASHNDAVRYYSFTVPQNCAYIRCPTSEVDDVDRESMLNVGSSPLPYEEYYAPYYDTVSYAKSISGAQTYTKFPIVLRTTQQSIPTWNVKGNMQQSGSPTPTTPITPQECGERTNNLFDYTTMADGVVGKYLNAGGTTTDDSRFTITDYIPCDTNTVTLYRGTLNNQPAICCYDENKNYITGISYNAQDPVTLTASQKFKYVRFSWKNSTHSEPDVLTRIRLNNGAYPLPYEPYGYKLPIVSGNTTTNAYLGEVQSTRKIKKYTFTGTETMFNFVQTVDQQNYCAVYRYADIGWTDILNYDVGMGTIDYPIFVSSHFTEKITGRETYNNIASGECGANNNAGYYTSYNRYIILCVSGITTANDFKIWLANQYANGTPVEVYYILATETTGIVNEPIRKIGDYADIVTNPVTIPTTSGLNTIDVATTLKPSEMSLTYDGYKLCKRQRYSRTENLFDDEYYFDNKVNTGGSNDWLAYQLEPNTAYTVSCNVPYVDNLAQMFVSLSSTSPTTTNNGVGLNNPRTITTDSTGVLYILSRGATAPSPLVEVTKQLWEQSNWWLMLNTGSIAKPYQPYLDWE